MEWHHSDELTEAKHAVEKYVKNKAILLVNF